MIKKITITVFVFLNSILFINNCIAQNFNQSSVKCPYGVNVNSFNGNMSLQRNDLFIAGRKFSLDMTFYYNSFDFKTNAGYGNGWRFQDLMKYNPVSGGIDITNADGRTDHYAGDSTSNHFAAPAGVFDSLSKYQTGKFVLITKNKMKYFFDNAQHKRLTRIEEPNGNFLSFNYTDSLVSSIADAAGRTLQMTYSAGKLVTLTDAIGSPIRVIHYVYDGYGNLTEVTDPTGAKIKYAYVLNGPMNTMTDKNGNTVDVIYQSNFAVQEVITCITDQRFSYNTTAKTTNLVETVASGNQVSTFVYDANGNLIKKTGNCCGYNVSFAYNNSNEITQFTDANANVTNYTYDSKGNLLSKKDPLGNFSRYTYEPTFNRVTSYTDKNGNITSYTYDNKGNITLANYPMGITRSFTYSPNGDMASSTDGNGNVCNYTYDTYGNVTGINKPLGVNIELTYDNKSRRATTTDPRGNTTAFAYDNLDRLTAVTDALNHNNSFAYDANGNITSITDRDNHITSVNYDALNRPITITDALSHPSHLVFDAQSNLLAFTDANGNTTHYAYDNLNRLIRNSNALNEITAYSYDGKGKLISFSLPNGNVYNITYDQLSRPKQVSDNIGSYYSYTYDNMNNLLSITDANGNTKNFNYDALNRRIGITDALGHSSAINYDNDFNITSFRDFNNKLKTFSYDALNRRTSYTDALGNATNFVYDLAGNLTSVTDANHNATSYIYDALNRHTQVTFADNTTNILNWDAKGNLLNYTDNNGAITTYSYDADDRLLQKSYPNSNNDVFTYDAGGRILLAINNDAIVAMTYDAANRIASETLNGKTTAYSYNIPGNTRTTLYPGGRTITHSFDARNRLNSINENNNPIATFTYDNANRMLSKNYPANNTSTTYSYDANNRIIAMLTNPGTKFNSRYAYDNNGNKLSENKLHRPDQSEQYGYDDEMRLTEFKSGTMAGNSIPSPLHEDDFNYDPLGNRTSVVEDALTTTYADNSMNEYTTVSGITATTLHYDNNGNVTDDGTFTYSYDINNHLTSVNNGVVSSYKYDALGRRIQKTVGTHTTDFIYSGNNEIENRDSAGNVIASFVFGSRIDDIISARINNNDFFYYKNALGSVNAIANSAGNIVERYEYDPFGKVNYFDGNYNPTTSSQIGNDILYTGRTMDNEINKYYYRAREYDETNGRFEQRDPLKYFSGDMNLYSYVKDKPTRFIDPFGADQLTPEIRTDIINAAKNDPAFSNALN